MRKAGRGREKAENHREALGTLDLCGKRQESGGKMEEGRARNALLE